MKKVAYSYSCIMAKLPESLAKKVRAMGDAIPDDMIWQDEKGEAGREKDVHVTVKYGLHTEDPEEVAKVIGAFGPVKATLRGPSAFMNDNVVMKLGVQGESLHGLNKEVCEGLEHTDTHPGHKPHVTVAYLKQDEDNPYYFTDYYSYDLDGEKFEVDEVEFSTPSGKRWMISLTDGSVRKKEGSEMKKKAAGAYSRDLYDFWAEVGVLHDFMGGAMDALNKGDLKKAAKEAETARKEMVLMKRGWNKVYDELERISEGKTASRVARKWRYKMDIKSLINKLNKDVEEGGSIEEGAKDMVKLLRMHYRRIKPVHFDGDKEYYKSVVDGLDEAIDEFEMVDDQDGFNYALDMLYDWGDGYDVWLGL